MLNQILILLNAVMRWCVEFNAARQREQDRDAGATNVRQYMLATAMARLGKAIRMRRAAEHILDDPQQLRAPDADQRVE